jgi:GPH family glycoside/pentoside/hexuronide:cation symporter
MLNWMTVDMVSIIFPYFLTYWIAQGNIKAELTLFGVTLPQDSIVLGLLFITAIIALPFWNWFSQKTSKRRAYIYGMGFWMIVQLLIITVKPGQTALIVILSILAGIGISTAHVLPDSIFPDVIEWERLRTKKSTEGVYYGTKNFTRKVTSALTIFLVLQALSWFGYQSPPEGAVVFQQNDAAVMVIRILTGPFGALLLLSSIIIAWFYPLTREKHARIRKLLIRRDNKTQD